MEQCENVNVIMRKLKNFISSTVRLSTNPKKKNDNTPARALGQSQCSQRLQRGILFYFFLGKNYMYMYMYVCIYIYIYIQCSQRLQRGILFIFFQGKTVYICICICVYIYIYIQCSQRLERGKTREKKLRKKKCKSPAVTLSLCQRSGRFKKQKK